MSAMTGPKPGDVVEAPDGKRRYVEMTTKNGRFQPGDIIYRKDPDPDASVYYCRITTWRQWCRKNDAREAGK